MKTRIVQALMVLAVLGLMAPGPAFAAKSYSADRYDVNVAVQQNGSLLVNETVVFRFVGGPFTFVFRDLPTQYTDRIADIQATLDGSPMSSGTGAGQVEITGTDPVRVRWHLPPTSDSTHTFGLTYRALGVVRQETGSDALYWQALPASYEYDIALATVKVNWDGTQARLLGDPQVTRGRANVDRGAASQATFTAQALRPNSPLQIALNYERGSLITAPPQWQARENEIQAQNQASAAWNAQFAPLYIMAALLLFICGALCLWVYARRYWRETPTASTGAFRPAGLPDDLPPAIAGALNGNGPAWSNALATLFDLAQRGVIQIDELPSGGWFHQKDFVLTLLSVPADLRSHERGLLTILFESKKGKQTSVKLSQVSQNLSGQWEKFAGPLKQEMQALGLVDPARQQARQSLIVASVTLLLLGAAVLVGSLFLIRALGPWFVIISFSVLGIAVVGFILALGLSPLSAQGFLRAARWQEFYKYLRYVLSGKESVYRADLFEVYLPYAASYGMAEEWARYLQKHSGIQIPPWFHALAKSNASDDGGASAFVAMMAATSSAGGAEGGAAGAAAGAAGGGASGAG